MSQNSPVPEWFGQAEAEPRQGGVATKRGLGCGASTLLVLLVVGAVSWAVTAELRVDQVEARLQRMQTEEAERRVGQARAPGPEQPAATPPPVLEPAVALPVPSTQVTAEEVAAAPSAEVAPLPGQRTAADIRKEMSRLRPAFRRCYDVVLEAHPTAAGRITLKLVIAPRGTVTSASTSVTGDLPPSVATCVAQVARTARFSPASDPTNVTFPIAFQSG